MAKNDRYAVLMGDLVGSSKAADRRKLHELFNKRIREANRRFADAVASPLTITLGDEFQGLARSLCMAFELSHFIRIALLLDDVASRFVVGTAVLETELNPKNAWNMMGKGLAEARRKLTDKRDPNCYRFSIPEREELELLLDGIGRSLTRIETGWTDTQIAYVARVLSASEKPRAAVAKALGVSENSLYKVLRSADFRLYSEQLATIRTVLGLEDQKRKAA